MAKPFLHAQRLFLAALCALAQAGPTPAAAQSVPGTVFVIDGSGSMWGTLGAERLSKFDLTRQALRQSLAAASPSARIGLVAFGHRRRGDCSDVEALSAPEAGPPDRVPSLVDKLNPKGKGPLTAALREAANLLPPAMPGNIVLIHDGPDNCQQDPCAAAAEIAGTHPAIAVHVIGLAPEPADAKQMSCIARATKGKMFSAIDAASLTMAMEEVVRITKLRSDGVPAPVPVTGLRSGGAVAGPPGLRLSAALTAEGEAVAAPVAWRIAKEGDAGAPAVERTAPEVAEDLPPGKYTVSAQLGLAQAQETIEVGETEPTVARLVLNAGVLKVAAHTTKTIDAIPEPLLTVSAAGETPKPIWVGRGAAAELIVPAGNYQVRVEDGLVIRETSVTVGAGALADTPVALASGQLELEAVAHEGGERLGDVLFAISEDDPDAPQGRREIARSADPQARFVLAPGTYYVTARHGAVEGRERIAVGSGDAVKRTLVLNLSRISVSALLDGAEAPAGETLTLRAVALDGGGRETARSTGGFAQFLLPAGRYRIEAQAGRLNVRTGAEADLAAGQEYKVTLKLESGEVTVKPAGDGAGGAAGRWEIRDQDGRTVLRSGRGAARTARLAPGQYLLRSEVGGQRAERVFDLKPGERRLVEIGMP